MIEISSVRSRMTKVAVLFAETHELHRLPYDGALGECRIHEVEINGDVFLATVDGYAGSSGKHDIDSAAPELICDESGKLQPRHAGDGFHKGFPFRRGRLRMIRRRSCSSAE